ncbi:hybrid sensor histidine kinase/response regulator [Anthocerotibacter panamensis]|uniref:hybrid sensor histidine kinase/response regulator n=1 Tax=Anthocerotibacter panamensis TaxID=2857077 RepID=UPI001C404E9A|nr:Hpt domain-containing protein [Anthocerotibacter panamensis]
MNPEVQQRVLGYFLEEAQDHIATMERGLMELAGGDPEVLQELFRAAHSLKGGAALLGLSTIRHLAHELEDHFRVIQEEKKMVDQNLEGLLLRVLDILQGLVQDLQSGRALTPERETQAEEQAQPLMQALAAHLSGEALPLAVGAPTEDQAQMRIQAYFIEECNDHLFTLERGLMAWRERSEDPELFNELFRAAHSIKGGAAMLGLQAIRRVAHELEDCFRLVQEQDRVVEERLEGLLLRVLDILRDLVGHLSTQGAITPEQAEQAQVRFQPVLQELTSYLGGDFDAPTLQDLLPEESALPAAVSRFTPDQERIVGYFLEEALEHLATLEQGLPQLTELSDDLEFLPELYRAAHSIKGGAAMLGLEGIRQVAYHLEHQLRTVNERDEPLSPSLQELFSAVCDRLALFVSELGQGMLTVPRETELLEQTGPLLDHLTQAMEAPDLVAVPALADLVEAVIPTVPPAEPEPAPVADPEPVAEPEQLLSEAETCTVVKLLAPSLEELANYFAHASFDEVREPLLTLTREFCELGEVHGMREWITLNQTLAMALIYHGDDSWQELGTQAMGELREAFDYIRQGQITRVRVSEGLQRLANPARPLEIPALEDLVTVTAPAPTPAVELDILGTLFGTEWPPAPAPSPVIESVVPTQAKLAPERRPKTASIVRRLMRVEVRHLDGLSNLVGELVINRNSLESQQNRLRLLLETLQQRVGQLNRISQELEEYYDRSIQGVRGERFRVPVNIGAVALTPPVLARESFDALEMDRYTPLHSISQEVMELIVRIKEVGSDIEFVTDQAEEATRQFRQLSAQLQEGLNQMRMLPLSEIVDRLPRAVRDLSVSLGKQVDLEIVGRETLVDKAILEELYDPLTHLTTNALMHGIEDPDRRTRLGKQAKGRIEVKAYHQGNQTVISVSDDGQGLAAQQIRAKAVAKGLLSPQEAQTLADSEVYPLVFLPGFTTAERITEVAGRGVGLDVVQNHINRLRGTVQLDSKPGQGTTFTIRLPLTLSISRAIICRNGRAPIAFPLDGIEDLIEVPIERIRREGQQQTIVWRERTLSFIDLNDLLIYNRASTAEKPELGKEVATVILRNGDTYVALGVDAFVEEQEVVIKQIKGPVPKPTGVAGVTILGNGQVLPIADIGELIGMVAGQVPFQARVPNLPLPDTKAASQTTVLIVDDSITVRELLSMTFVKAGYRVEQARDGQEALEKLKSGLTCDLVFCDVEMPRMDGFEFLAQIQKDGRLKSLPVAMLTSRSAEKHRQTAYQLGAKGYFTKPYLEDDLLRGAEQLLKTSRAGLGV